MSNSVKGIWPKARDGHNTAVMYNKYMVIYAGLDDKDNVIQDIFLYDIENSELKKVYITTEDSGESNTYLDNYDFYDTTFSENQNIFIICIKEM